MGSCLCHDMAILGEERTRNIQGSLDGDKYPQEEVDSWKSLRFFDRRWKNDCVLLYMPSPSVRHLVVRGRTKVFKYAFKSCSSTALG
jgi:hypothetical protein